jgi:hypothetical protein
VRQDTVASASFQAEHVPLSPFGFYHPCKAHFLKLATDPTDTDGQRVVIDKIHLSPEGLQELLMIDNLPRSLSQSA